MRVLPVLAVLLALSWPSAAQVEEATTGPQGRCDNNGAIVAIGAKNSYKCSAEPDGPGCTNNGVYAAIGTGHRYECDTGPHPCTNHGLVLMLGPGNTYDCGGPCHGGIVLNVMGDYCGRSGLVVACVEERPATPALAAKPGGCSEVDGPAQTSILGP